MIGLQKNISMRYLCRFSATDKTRYTSTSTSSTGNTSQCFIDYQPIRREPLIKL